MFHRFQKAAVPLFAVASVCTFLWIRHSTSEAFRGALAAGEAARLEGKFDQAEDHFKAAHKQVGGLTGPGDDSLKSLLYEEAELYLDMGRLPDAERVLREALVSMENVPDAGRREGEFRLLLGRALVRQRKFDEGRTELESAFRLLAADGPDNRASFAARDLSDVYLRSDNLPEARRYADESLRYAKRDRQAVGNSITLGWSEHQLGRLSMANADYLGAVKQFESALKNFDHGTPPPNGADLDRFLQDFIRVAEVLQQQDRVNQLRARLSNPPSEPVVIGEGNPQYFNPNPKLWFAVERAPGDSPIELFDQRVNLKAIGETTFEAECRHTNSELRFDFQVELLDQDSLGPSTPMGRIFNGAKVTLEHQDAEAEEWRLEKEHRVMYSDAIRWTCPAGVSRMRVSFGSPKASADIRVKLAARAL